MEEGAYSFDLHTRVQTTCGSTVVAHFLKVIIFLVLPGNRIDMRTCTLRKIGGEYFTGMLLMRWSLQYLLFLHIHCRCTCTVLLRTQREIPDPFLRIYM